MHGDDETGDELAGPAGWPSEQGFPQGAYEWPPAPPGLVHGVDALDEYSEVGKAAPKGPQAVKVVHEPKHGKNPPWLTWGNTVVQTVTGQPLVASIGPLVQLVNLRYGRPETWRFFLAANLLSTSDGNPPVVDVQVQFQLTIGNGFTSYTDNFFQVLEFAAASPLGSARLCTQSEQLPAKLSDTAPNVIELIPAQDVYIAANIVTTGSIGAGVELSMALTAMVAPNVHVRPGWHLDIFAGGEERF
jgi:hypothetical protein